jgi:DNA invertase Pin-like site-specific DNA recombinase
MYSYALMEGMIAQTLAPYAQLPGVSEVREAGVKPLVSPEGTQFKVHRYRAKRTNAVTFAHEGCLYLYSLGTASQVNTPEGDNAWMKLLCEFVLEFRPVHLYVANFNRLIRSALFSGDLMRAVEATGTVLHASGIRIDLAEPQGRVLWQTLAMLSDLERESIVQRLFGGTINQFNRGDWILSPEAVPPGYRLVDRKVVLDPAAFGEVRFLIGLLADPELSARQIVDAAGARGISSRTVRRLYGEAATLASVQRADSKVRALTKHAAVWATGTVEVRLVNPFRGAARIGSIPVVGADPPRHHGYVHLRYALELPPGGWAAPEVLAAVAARTETRRKLLGRGAVAQGGAAHRRRRPMAGWSTTGADGCRYYLGGTSAFYIVMRQDAAATSDEVRGDAANL